jgi:hypothetical protein
MTDRPRCNAVRRGCACTRRANHFGLHRGRSRFGGSHEQWTTDERHVKVSIIRRKRPHPGPTHRKRRAAKARKAEKDSRRAAVRVKS